ncbi:MAG: hypothetical protein SGI92_02205 [Bryobacteraceae bacterium]|nr:hypothetical protein [Bryobacteraceae bacterium]
MRLTGLDLLIIAAYLLVIGYITMRSRVYSGQSAEHFFLGGRNMPGWMTGISYAASMISADSAVAYGGLAAVTGAYVCWFYLSRFGIALFLGAVLFAVFWKRLNTFTTLEFYELRFSGRPASLIRLWLALRTSLVAMVAWTGISLLALVKIAEPILGWSKAETLWFASLLAIGYVLVSGYVGVVLSNIVQIVVLTVGSVFMAVKVLIVAGGPSALGQKLGALHPSMLDTFPGWGDPVFPAMACIAWMIGTSVGYGGDAAPMGGAVEGQRILSSRSLKDACGMYVVTEVTLFTLVLLVSLPCLAAVLFWPGLRDGSMDRELAYGLLMTHYLGPGLLGLVFAAMLGGIISVVGDNLNFGSQVLLNDVYRRYLVPNASDRHYLIAGKLSLVLILGLSLLVVYQVSFVFDVAIFMVGLSAVEMAANWAQWWWWRFNGLARMAASFGGALSYIAIWLMWPSLAWWYRMYASMAITTVLWVVISLVTKPEPDAMLRAFVARARPLGFWGPYRQSSPGKIARGIVLACTGAFAVMLYILSLSKLYLGAYGAAGMLGATSLIVAAAFYRSFSPFLKSLMTAAEQAAEQEAALGDSMAIFDFGRLGLVVFGTIVVVCAIWAVVAPDAAGRYMAIAATVSSAAGCMICWRRSVRS